MPAYPATVLVIEEHPLMRAAICTAIADEPDLIIGAIAAKGSDTYQIVETLHPDVILYAVGNPGDEDLAIIQTLRRKSPTSAILALTSAEVDGQEQAALASGADAVLTKTARRSELLKSLRDLKRNSLEAGNSRAGVSGRLPGTSLQENEKRLGARP